MCEFSYIQKQLKKHKLGTKIINSLICFMFLGIFKFAFFGTLFVCIAYVIVAIDPLDRIVKDVSCFFFFFNNTKK